MIHGEHILIHCGRATVLISAWKSMRPMLLFFSLGRNNRQKPLKGGNTDFSSRCLGISIHLVKKSCQWEGLRLCEGQHGFGWPHPINQEADRTGLKLRLGYACKGSLSPTATHLRQPGPISWNFYNLLCSTRNQASRHMSLWDTFHIRTIMTIYWKLHLFAQVIVLKEGEKTLLT